MLVGLAMLLMVNSPILSMWREAKLCADNISVQHALWNEPASVLAAAVLSMPHTARQVCMLTQLALFINI